MVEDRSLEKQLTAGFLQHHQQAEKPWEEYKLNVVDETHLVFPEVAEEFPNQV